MNSRKTSALRGLSHAGMSMADADDFGGRYRDRVARAGTLPASGRVDPKARSRR